MDISNKASQGEAMVDAQMPVGGENHVCVGIVGTKKIIALCGKTDADDFEESLANARKIADQWNSDASILDRRIRLLGQLLMFISDVAITIRMNSSYNPQSQHDPDTPHAVMHLSDALHNLDQLGRALAEGDHNQIVYAAESQAQYLDDCRGALAKFSSQNMPGQASGFDIDWGIRVLQQIAALD